MGKSKKPILTDDAQAFALFLRDDPIAFCRHICKLNPHPAQKEFLTLNLIDGMHVCLPWFRQGGKSTIVAFYICWALFSIQGFRAFLFAPSGDQTKEIYNKICHIYETSPFLKRYIPAKQTGDTLTVGNADWDAKVELVRTGLTGDLGRGRSSSGKGIIVFDEFAHFLYGQQLRGSLTPIIASGGGEVVLSSPGDPGSPMHRLYETWKAFHSEGNSKYRVIECDWKQCPHITADWIESQRKEHESQGTQWIFEREILGRWVAPANTWFAHADIERCVLPSRPTHKRGDVYVWGMDAAGRGRSAFVVMIATFNQALGRMEVIDLRSFMFTNHKYRRDDTGSEIVKDFDQIEEILCDLRDQYPPAWIGFDPNTERSLFGRLENVYRLPMSEILVGGYQQKERFLVSLRKGISEGKVVWSDERITDQLRKFCPRKEETTGRWKWPETNTDIIVALGNIYQYLGEMDITPFDVTTGNRQSSEKFSVW